MSGLYTPISGSRVGLSQKLQHCNKIFVECESLFEGVELQGQELALCENMKTLSPCCAKYLRILNGVFGLETANLFGIWAENGK